MIAHITDHVQAGLALLIEQYRGKPRLEGMLTAYLNRVQELEDATWSVITGRLIDYAVGVQLDVLGKLVGQARQTDLDEPYRARIRARIRANRSLGHAADLVAVAMLAANATTSQVTYEELQPATALVDILLAIDPAVAPAIRDLLGAAKPLGVALALAFSGYPDGETFALAIDDTLITDAARGFGPSEDPAAASGGRWIDSL